ncbi:MAG: hypothetical protein E6I60_09020 [Chloroflexi bacterium]|nr:MAG: hypothetical protein E6I60_09020 [Chloroflexota bacterium]
MATASAPRGFGSVQPGLGNLDWSRRRLADLRLGRLRGELGTRRIADLRVTRVGDHGVGQAGGFFGIVLHG